MASGSDPWKNHFKLLRKIQVLVFSCAAVDQDQNQDQNLDQNLDLDCGLMPRETKHTSSISLVVATPR